MDTVSRPEKTASLTSNEVTKLRPGIADKIELIGFTNGETAESIKSAALLTIPPTNSSTAQTGTLSIFLTAPTSISSITPINASVTFCAKQSNESKREPTGPTKEVWAASFAGYGSIVPGILWIALSPWLIHFAKTSERVPAICPTNFFEALPIIPVTCFISCAILKGAPSILVILSKRLVKALSVLSMKLSLHGSAVITLWPVVTDTGLRLLQSGLFSLIKSWISGDNELRSPVKADIGSLTPGWEKNFLAASACSDWPKRSPNSPVNFKASKCGVLSPNASAGIVAIYYIPLNEYLE